MINRKLKEKLIELADDDQKMRASRKWNKSVDKINILELKRIVSKFGWPDIDMVGEKASSAAWLLIQHADADTKFQEKILKLMRKKYEADKIPSWQIAYLTDRVLINKGQAQIYGTQFYLTKNRRFINRPIKNKSTLDKRRRKMNLDTFSKYKKTLTEAQKKTTKKVTTIQLSLTALKKQPY